MASTTMTLTGAGIGSACAYLIVKYLRVRYPALDWGDGDVSAIAALSTAVIGTFKEVLDWTCNLCRWCVELKRRSQAGAEEVSTKA